MPLTGKNHIASQLSAEGADLFFSVDPRSKTRRDLPFHSATRNEVGRAVEAAGGCLPRDAPVSAGQTG